MTREHKQELIEMIINDMCDDKCRMPDRCSNDELDEVCDKCPINDLWLLAKEG